MITVEGKYGVYAKVLKHSISPQGVNLITFEVQYPRIVLAELNTHGMICKNSSSSRAIPFAKMAENLIGRPIRFGANQAGMQDKGGEHEGAILHPYKGEFLTAAEAWAQAGKDALAWAKAFFDAGYHKQVYNRLTESQQMMKTVLSATETANFYWLRDHDAADPSLQELARCMHEAAKQSKPELLQPGEWHLPYVETAREDDGTLSYRISQCEDFGGIQYLTLDEAIKVSSARCAAVSFRNVDYDVEKSESVYNRLISDLRIHGSAFQHQGTPMKACSGEEERGGNIPSIPTTWEEGITHMDRDGQLWSAQFKGWRMHRKLIPGENKPGFLLEDSQC